MFEAIEKFFHVIVRYGIMLMEIIGVIVLLYSAACALIRLLRKEKENVSLRLAKGIALALEFLLCGEIMHTLVVRDMQELILVGAIVLMRIARTLLIHWEAGHEKAEKHDGGHEY